jgi:hypothetical protein
VPPRDGWHRRVALERAIFADATSAWALQSSAGMRNALWTVCALASLAGAGCEPTSCEDLCQQELDACLTDADGSEEASECTRARNQCVAVCDGGSGSGQFDLDPPASAGAPAPMPLR